MGVGDGNDGRGVDGWSEGGRERLFVFFVKETSFLFVGSFGPPRGWIFSVQFLLFLKKDGNSFSEFTLILVRFVHTHYVVKM